jgi:H+-transporting ATPase
LDFTIIPSSGYKDISLDETLRLLRTSLDGLTENEAGRRLKDFGYNEIKEKKKSPVLEFLLRFWGPMPWLLELAMALSFLLSHHLEGIIILVLLTFNAIIGQVHSLGSRKTAELLRKKLALRAKVERDGTWVIKKSREIVPGDIVAVKLGDIVPADARIVQGKLSVDQSALTGESMPAGAHGGDVIYSGSVVRQGEARCVVVNSGPNTYFGRTAELVSIAGPRSHQEEVMLDIVKYMMYLGIAASVLVSAYALVMHTGFLLILTFVVIFLMGAVPVALPAVLTIVQAVGAMQLAGKGALVTRLSSIEDASSIDVLCLDKTGTITQNRISVSEGVPFAGYKEEDVLRIAAMASQEEGMDIIDLAVIERARSKGIDVSSYRLIEYTPFNPEAKRSEAVLEADKGSFKAVKGAVRTVMSMCSGMDQAAKEKLEQTVEDLSHKGYRIIAVALSEAGDFDDLRLAGLLVMTDPPRTDSKGMIEEARRLGIKPMMLTGDNLSIAKEIARQVGIGDNIIRFSDIAAVAEDEKVSIIESIDGFAEIYPEDKYSIVKTLQAGGHVVGMTGDGVNDAPALKQAEMGIAVSNATDVAKASASMVLTAEGLGVIIDAVKISRQTYQRMLTWVINKVTKVIEFAVLLTLSFFWLHDIVLSMLGMSLLVFANDFVTMSLATDNVKDTIKPNRWNVKDITLASLIPGMLLVAEGMIVIFIGTQLHLDWERLRTLVMLNLVFNSQFRVLIVRERRHFWSSVPGRDLLFMTGLTITGFALIGVYGIFIPSLAVSEVLAVLAFSAVFTLCIDFPKYYFFRKFGL